MKLQDTLRYGLYLAAAVVIAALTGMFGKFQVRFVLANSVTLSTVLLIIVFAGTAYFVAWRSRQNGAGAVVVSGLISSLIVGLALALLVIIEANIDLTFVFENLKADPIAKTLLFGQPLAGGLLLLLLVSAVLGIIGGLLVLSPTKVRQLILVGFALTTVIGLLEAQINRVMTLPDAIALVVVFGGAYIASLRLPQQEFVMRLGLGVGIGVLAGVILALIANSGGLESGGILRGSADVPRLLNNPFLAIVAIFAVIGGLGAVVASAPTRLHNAAVYLVGSLFILGVLNWQVDMTVLAAVITFAMLVGMGWWLPALGEQAEARFTRLDDGQQGLTQRSIQLVALAVMLIAPIFMGQYITSVLDLVGLYVIMGIGLNVVVGYAGLLDLGYVAFFAIGAYALGILTTPSLVTCGGVPPRSIKPQDIQTICTGVMTFWQAWPLAILITGIAGVLLGIPVLRLRGDYLAIVTLGFGEIIRLITLSNDFKPLLGGAQGVANIPGPALDLTFLNPAWRFELGTATSVYYLILVAVVVVAFVTLRLSSTRLGRAWRAMRADEDVAQAMGINLVQTKLLAFAVGAACAGMGGAIFGSWLQGIFPNSFTLAVSINVLSLIIIGGLGSIPGVLLGSLILIGLPEVLRELQDYRLLAFGMLLVTTMLLKPEGIIPPPVRRLSEAVTGAGKGA
jgi:ABC-type branched-subunit amino acid transport system permease subunit